MIQNIFQFDFLIFYELYQFFENYGMKMAFLGFLNECIVPWRDLNNLITTVFLYLFFGDETRSINLFMLDDSYSTKMTNARWGKFFSSETTENKKTRWHEKLCVSIPYKFGI